MEISRMKAKALRERREAELSQAAPNTSQPATGAKRVKFRAGLMESNGRFEEDASRILAG
jgi:hypothetical protein